MSQHLVPHCELLHLPPDLLHDPGELLAKHHRVLRGGDEGDSDPPAHGGHDVLDIEGRGHNPHQHLVRLEAGPGHILGHREEAGDLLPGGGPSGEYYSSHVISEDISLSLYCLDWNTASVLCTLCGLQCSGLGFSHRQ